MTAYREKILALLQRMENLIGKIRHPNIPAVMRYLGVVRPLVERMTRPFQGNTDLLSLSSRFQKYSDEEEARLRRGLETAKYDLDALDTIAFINGRRGLERVCSYFTSLAVIFALICGNFVESLSALVSSPHPPLQHNRDSGKICSPFR